MLRRNLTWFGRLGDTVTRYRAHRRVHSVLRPLLQPKESFFLKPPREDLAERVGKALPWIPNPTLVVPPQHRFRQPPGSVEIRLALTYHYGRAFCACGIQRRWVPGIVQRLLDDYHAGMLPHPVEHRQNTLEILELLAQSALCGEPNPELLELARLASEGNEILFVDQEHATVFVRCGDPRTSIRVPHEAPSSILTQPVPT